MRFGQKYCPERKAKREIREIYKKQKKVYQRINERNNKTYNQYFIFDFFIICDVCAGGEC